LQNALGDYSKAIALEPAASVNYHYRAHVLASLGRYDEALRDYDAANARYPSADADIGRGWVLQKLDRPAEALAAYGRAIDGATGHDEQMARALTERGNTYLGLNRLDEALADFAEAVRLRPDSAHVHSLRGWLHEKQGRRDLAHADYERSAALSSPTPGWRAPSNGRAEHGSYFHSTDPPGRPCVP